MGTLLRCQHGRSRRSGGRVGRGPRPRGGGWSGFRFCTVDWRCGVLSGAAVGQYMDRQQRALEAELSGSGVGVARQGDNLVLRMPSDVTFASNQSSVNSSFTSSSSRSF